MYSTDKVLLAAMRILVDMHMRHLSDDEIHGLAVDPAVPPDLVLYEHRVTAQEALALIGLHKALLYGSAGQ